MLHNEGYKADVSNAPPPKKNPPFKHWELTKNGLIQAVILLKLHQLGNSHANTHPSFFHLIIF